MESQLLKKDVCVEVYNRLAGEGVAPNIKANYNWLTIAWFQRGVHTESDVRNFVKVVKSALSTDGTGLRPAGCVRVTRD